MNGTSEIIIYNPDETIKIEVRLEVETLWLTQAQIGTIFGVDRTVIVRHIGNIYKSGELDRLSTCAKIAQLRIEKDRQVSRCQNYYNLDVVLSVGYRVNSPNATAFRIWANKVLKEYLLRGYAVNQRIENLEQRVTQTEEKIDFFVRTSLPPTQGIFFDGQIFDAYTFAANLIRSAKKELILIDNYIDESVLTMLDKREECASVCIYTKQVSTQLQLDIEKHNAQYKPITIKPFNKAHDRFLIVDDNVYHIGASLKDLGKKWFAFSLMHDIDKMSLLSKLT